MSPSFDLYRIFYYVASHKSITKAAKFLYVTQPTVTHAIQVLERELECTLFLRSQKGVELTPEAEMLYSHVSTACKHIFEAESNIKSLKSLAQGLVYIGASETTLHHFLLPYLKKFRKSYPDIHIKVANLNSPAAINSILSGMTDLGVLIMPEGYKDSRLIVKELSDFQDIVIASRQYSQLMNKEISLSQLSEYPIVTMEKGTFTRKFLEEFYIKNNCQLDPSIELGTSDLITPVVKSGLGIGFVPQAFAHDELKKQTIFQIQLKEQLPKRKICLIQNASKPFQ